MKKLLFALAFLAITGSVRSQEMRDSAVYVEITARPCIISVFCNGVTVRDTMTAEQVAAWIMINGMSVAPNAEATDTTRPVQDGILYYLSKEIERCQDRVLRMKREEQTALDPDTMTIEEFRQAWIAINLKYRRYTWGYNVKVPVL